MAVKTYKSGEKLSPHFRSDEFKCKCGCGRIKTDTALVATLEELFKALPLHKIDVVSGYRCPKHDKAVGGKGSGSHVEGYAVDVVCFYDEENRVPSSVVALTLERMGHKFGIGYRCGRVKDTSGNIHIDTKPRKWYGDESLPNGMSATACKSYFEYLVPFKVKVIDPDKNGLNIRKTPGTGAVVGQYKTGEVVAITATDATHTWGKTDKGWICIKSAYVRMGAR